MTTPAEPPSEPEPEPQPRSTGKVVAIIVAAVVGFAIVLIAAGAIFEVLGGGKHLTTPDTVDGKPKVVAGTIADVADRVESGISDNGGDHAAAAFYGIGQRPSFLVAGADTGVFSNADDAVDDLLRGFSSGATAAQIGTSTTYPAGKSGGTVRCGTFVIGTVNGTYCGFSDKNVGGILVSYDLATPADAAALTDRVRQQIEK